MWFNTPERLEALRAIATSWIGTPLRSNSQTKGYGGGVSCTNLCAAIFVETGCLAAFDLPEGPMNWASHNTESMVIPWMDAHPRFAGVSNNEPILPGDALGFKFGACVHHMGVCDAPGTFIHVLKRTGVMYSLLGDATYSKRLVKIWRPRP